MKATPFLSMKLTFKSIGCADKRRSCGIEASSRAHQIIVSVEGFHCQIRETGLSLAQQLSRATDNHPGTRRITDSPLKSSIDPPDNVTHPSDNTALNTTSAIVPYPKSRHSGSSVQLTLASTENCTLDCCCSCHKNRFTRSPQFLTRVLGSLFLGYRAAPWFAQPCNDPLCRAGTVQVSYVYVFPQWLLSRALQASVAYNHARGPELILRMMRVRDYGTGAFGILDASEKFPSKSEFLSVKASIDNAESSVLDVTPAGWTLLHVSRVAYLNQHYVSRNEEFVIMADLNKVCGE